MVFESFGFKHGIPIDADYVFDVRFLPNPHWDPKLRPMTGLAAGGSVPRSLPHRSTQFYLPDAKLP